MRLVLQELIEAEPAEVIGAGRSERTPDRVTGRNGSSQGVGSSQIKLGRGIIDVSRCDKLIAHAVHGALE